MSDRLFQTLYLYFRQWHCNAQSFHFLVNYSFKWISPSNSLALKGEGSFSLRLLASPQFLPHKWSQVKRTPYVTVSMTYWRNRCSASVLRPYRNTKHNSFIISNLWSFLRGEVSFALLLSCIDVWYSYPGVDAKTQTNKQVNVELYVDIWIPLKRNVSYTVLFYMSLLGTLKSNISQREIVERG